MDNCNVIPTVKIQFLRIVLIKLYQCLRKSAYSIVTQDSTLHVIQLLYKENILIFEIKSMINTLQLMGYSIHTSMNQNDLRFI